MMTTDLIDEEGWCPNAQPTAEELYRSGGLQVEDWPHARQVMSLAAQLFEATRKLHRLGEQELRLLERAALLHNAGMLIEERRHHKHSFRLINETNLPDFSEAERYEIACIARYHRRALPNKQHPEFASLSHAAKKRVSILSAILRIADALDYNHDGRVLHLNADLELCDARTWVIQLRVRTLADLDDELENAYAKADLFERVFKQKLRFTIKD
ncbi:HD domain-containing protein [Ktedonosporobacter rubrisoli]|uniref:HD domain-containing protein n=1 Tax=Ktedonosporobacter rubrisoli TaxID=2509675 RepID=A0A4V0YZ92_KTERU|nr:HD domain-containing protein [Ktedonosporobacter rubrisoli]QBD78911.1 HD domain-containing protein [Ktedonosporobacter rubrisoli]